MDQLINNLTKLNYIIPWISLIAGFSGSLHCVGMCGGLVTATCQKSNDIIRYQLGRLLGYLALGLFAGSLGKLFSLELKNPKLALIPGIFIGILFLYWGIQNYRGIKAEIPTPKIYNKIYQFLFSKLVRNNQGLTKSFLVGLFSIFLPCGLLYGIVLGSAAFDHSFQAIFSMFFFWLGTLPSMVLAPKIIQKFLVPLKSGLPKTYAISLMLIGLLTISYRVSKFNENVTMNKAQIQNLNSNAPICH